MIDVKYLNFEHSLFWIQGDKQKYFPIEKFSTFFKILYLKYFYINLWKLHFSFT